MSVKFIFYNFKMMIILRISFFYTLKLVEIFYIRMVKKKPNTAHKSSVNDLKKLFRMFRKKLRKELSTKGRCEPHYTLKLWKACNREKSTICPVPFKKVFKSALSSHASS